MKDRLIGLHNHQIQFSVDDEVYIIPRKKIETEFCVYWFKGDLYRTIKILFSKNKDWFNKYKI